MRFSAARVIVARAVVVLCGVAGCMALWSAAASAEVAYELSGTFGSFSNPSGVAVDNSGSASKGDVYIANISSGTVAKFNAAGSEELATLRGTPLEPFINPAYVAVDDSGGSSGGDLYVSDRGTQVVDRFTAVGVYVSQISKVSIEGGLAGGFEPSGVAVNPSNGDLYVGDRAEGGRIDELAEASGGEWKLVREFGKGEVGAVESLAVDAHGDVYAVDQEVSVREFGEAGVPVVNGTGTNVVDSVSPQAVAVDPSTGDVFVGENILSPSFKIVEYSTPGAAPIREFGEGDFVGYGSYGLAVNATTHDVYGSLIVGGFVDLFTTVDAAPEIPDTEAASEVQSRSATLHGELNPGGLTAGLKYHFEYNTAGQCAGGESSPTVQVAEGQSGEKSVEAKVTGLLPNTPYTVCLIATNALGQAQGAAVGFTTSAVPATIEGESFSAVGSSNVTLNAEIDPNGSATSSYWEYGPSEAYGSRTPEVPLGEGQSVLPVPTHLEGLAANSEYHLRVVAVNAVGTEHGSDITFRTLPATPLGLPDGRVYEKVSSFGSAQNGTAQAYIPSVYIDELILAEGIFTLLPFQAAADGEAAVYAGDPSNGGNGKGGQNSGNEYMATRLAGGGWRQVNIQPHGRLSARYQAFSSDLTSAVLTASSVTGAEDGLPPLSPEAPGDGYTDLFQHAFTSEAYEPFFTDDATIHRPAGGLEVVYAGASADFGEQLFQVNDALTENAKEITGSEYLVEGNLYVSVGGRLSLINVPPGDSSSEPQATFGSLTEEGRLYNGDHEVDLSHVISADGSRVFWTDLRTKDLYVRENPTSSDAKTVEIAAGGHFWTASADGSRVFYTDGGLYEYEVENDRTTDLTPGVEVVGVVGASEDGESLYYVDSSNNLYLWHAGVSTLVAANLSSRDSGNEHEPIPPYVPLNNLHRQVGDWAGQIGQRTSEVTPGGGAVVFMSNRSLPVVGYPHGYSNDGLEEVYVYEAEGGGSLFCVSCGRSGEAPPSAGYGAAAFLPVSWMTTEQPQVISDDGSRVFFDSWEPLVSQDTNGKLDVYEWERDGAGSCHESEGCVYLLSGGTSSSSSWFLGASASGDDAFVISRADLTAGSGYEGFAVYDARVGGVQPVASPVCTGSGCQGVPPAAPIFATPASVTFAGVGNFPAPSTTAPSRSKPRLKGKARSKSVRVRELAGALRACERRRGRARSLCVARARRRYGAGSGAGKSSLRVEGR